jgi:colanic acid biosynthesis glycosyl transferase WcaI
MRVLILGLNYLPESTSIGPYTADLAEYLRDRGHEIRVVTGFPIAPQWKVWKGYRRKLFMREVVRGVPVTRTYLYVPKHPKRALQRILFDCSFAASAFFGAILGKRPDLVIVISPPLQLAITAFLIHQLTRARVLLEIKDLVPDAAIAVGALREGSRAVRMARSLERFAYRTAESIGVICEGMRSNLIDKGVPERKVSLLPDYIDLNFMTPASGDNDFRQRAGIGREQFLAMYSGSIAGKQGLETFVEAGAEFESDANVTCCVIGEGPYLPELNKTAAALGLRRFQFLPLQPRESLPRQLSAADVLVITQRKTVKDVVFPGKLLYYMSSGRAILAAVSEDSETGRFIRAHQVGVVVAPEDPAALAEGIRWLRDNPRQTSEFGRNGRRVVERQFDRSVVLEKFAIVIEQRSCVRDRVLA